MNLASASHHGSFNKLMTQILRLNQSSQSLFLLDFKQVFDMRNNCV